MERPNRGLAEGDLARGSRPPAGEHRRDHGSHDGLHGERAGRRAVAAPDPQGDRGAVVALGEPGHDGGRLQRPGELAAKVPGERDPRGQVPVPPCQPGLGEEPLEPGREAEGGGERRDRERRGDERRHHGGGSASAPRFEGHAHASHDRRRHAGPGRCGRSGGGTGSLAIDGDPRGGPGRAKGGDRAEEEGAEH